MKQLRIVLIALMALALGSGSIWATEPNMADYTAYPIFMSQSVKPNIMIILDNSGSMNFPAYGEGGIWNGTVVDDPPYAGSPYTATIDVRVSDDADDGEESSSGNTYDDNDLDLAGIPYVAVRFQNVSIPNGATITNAYITFEAIHENSSNSNATTINIYGEAADEAESIDFSETNNISGRTTTSASVTWSPGSWTAGHTYDTPDLSSIVQELVNRDGWNEGSSMVFIFTGTGYREAKAHNEDPNAAPVLHVEYTGVRYYGYFDPDARYSYDSGDSRFERDSSGDWSGNFLNWLCMRRIDVAKKILVGGQATVRDGSGQTTLVGDDHAAQSGRYWRRKFTDNIAPHPTPYTGTEYWYGIRNGRIYVDNDSNPFSGWIARFEIRVLKTESEEPDEFLNGNIAGVLQRVGDRARFGLAFYNHEDDADGYDQGGEVRYYVDDDHLDNIVSTIEVEDARTWTPLAESFHEIVRYFRQDSPYYFSSDYTVSDTWDPYYWNDLGEHVECAKSFVLLITDGESTQDLKIPSSLQNYYDPEIDETLPPDSASSNGSDYLDDVALWAHTEDMRTDLDGEQTITLYPVFAFGQGSFVLREAAITGGFIDKNGNNFPDLQEEWDADGNGIPDNYFEAKSGFVLERRILQALTDILKRAAAGTAVSVLATSSEGEGTLVQAFFRPSVTSNLNEIKWIGFLQSLWIDQYGNIREDTDHDLVLDVTKDNVIEFFFDEATGDTKIRRFSVSSSSPYPDLENDPYAEIILDDIEPIWEAGDKLAQRSASDRKIFTYLDKDSDGVVDEPSGDNDPFDDDGEVVRFHTGSASAIKPYLGVKDDPTWQYLGTTHDDRVTNLIQFIRGEAVSGLRNRTIDGSVWKLGDIVHSTPVSISKPVENYHIIYSDESYHTFFNEFKNRETVVYVGANDGMLHAFTSWRYDSANKQFVNNDGEGNPLGSEQIGDELWAYIPQALLPHLKWLADPDYTHVYYVDLKPKVFDAKILDDDTHYTDADTDPNWGTILLVGLRMGGKHIWAEGDFDEDSSTSDTTKDFYPTYICMDVTDPRNPRLLWERTYSELGMTMSTPAVVKVKDKWFAVFGSGPDDYEGNSTKKGHIFVVDLKTGEPYKNGSNDWLFETSEDDAFMNSPVSLDKDLNYNVDVIYFGEAYKESGNWKGKLYKVMVPWVSSGAYDGTDPNNYVDDPKDSTNPWILAPLLEATRPITAPVALTLDQLNNVWVYVGSGRYLSEDDKTNNDQQYIFGVKDPFYNQDHTSSGAYGTDYYHNYSSNLELSISDLFNANPYVVIEGGEVYMTDGSYFGTFDLLVQTARDYNGWIRSLEEARERIVTKFAVIGGIVFTPSFVPNSDICGFGGESFLYGQYFETGTAYKEEVFSGGTETVTIGGTDYQKVLDRVSLGAGKASAVGLHVGMEEGAKAFVQQSTGVVVSENVQPAFNIKSGLRSWREK